MKFLIVVIYRDYKMVLCYYIFSKIDNYFRFSARLVNDGQCDKDRKFTISYFLSDDTIQINVIAEKVDTPG